MANTKYRGVAVPMNGRIYVVPALSLRDFREHADVLLSPVAATTPEEFVAQFEKRVHVIQLAIARNYPEVTKAELMEWLDLDTVAVAFLAVQNAAGLVKVEDDGQGNG